MEIAAATNAAQEGDYINAGSSPIAIVPLPNVCVIANWKTQLPT
jgi:hypothetical protein